LIDGLFFFNNCQLFHFFFTFAPAVTIFTGSSFLSAAQMAKLVDALVSGTSVSNDVQVRVLFWAPQKAQSAERRAESKTFFAKRPMH
jgi:hypothetical protein